MNGEQKNFLVRVLSGIGIFLVFIVLAATSSFETPELALYCGLFIGAFANAFIPFLRKLQAGEIGTFSVQYFWTVVMSFFYMIPTVYGLTVIIDVTGLHWLLSAWIGFTLGYGGEEVAKEVLKNMKNLVEKYRQLQETSEE